MLWRDIVACGGAKVLWADRWCLQRRNAGQFALLPICPGLSTDSISSPRTGHSSRGSLT